MSPARKPQPPDELSLRAWAAELEAAAQIARQLAPTAFIPESLKRFYVDDRGRPLDGKDGRTYRLDVDATTATAAAAILTGQELGLKPMAALRSIAVIGNTPTLNAITLRAILQSAGHDIWVAPESNATRAIVRARRDGQGEVQQSIWTIDRARTLGLYPGSERSNWRRQPQNMLVARATAEAARWIAADAILGIPYIAEELIDELDGASLNGDHPAIEAPAAADATEGKAGRKRASRKRAEQPPALPAAPPLPTGPAGGSAEPGERTEPGIAKPQLDRLHAGLREIGMDDREQGLALVSGFAHRTVGTTTDLTASEARSALDGIDALRKVARKRSRSGDGGEGQAAADPEGGTPGDDAEHS